MALIKCPECGREVSDTSLSCVHCGFVFSTPSQAGMVTIYLPNDLKRGFANLIFRSDEETVVIKSGNKYLWDGRGQKATFKVDGPTQIQIDLGVFVNPVVCVVEPKKVYTLKREKNKGLKPAFSIEEQ